MSNLLEIFEETAASCPDKLAVVDENQGITYRDLRRKARNLAFGLLKLGQKRRPIFVLSGRNLESVAGFLGVLYSGNFYVPVDEGVPRERFLLLLESIKPAAVLGSAEQMARLREAAGEPGAELRERAGGLDTVFLGYEELEAGPEVELRERAGSIDGDAAGSTEGIIGKRIDEAVAGILDTDPLYMVFTSGSTGTPKGVLKTHRSMLAFLKEFIPLFHFSDKDVFGNQAPFDFDISAKDLYTCFSVGGTLCLIPGSCFVIPSSLPVFLNAHKVNTLMWAASAVAFAAAARCFELERPLYVEKVLFSGEALPARVLNQWMDLIPAAMYVNLYAPSEVTGNCLYHVVEGKLKDGERIPLGKPFPNMEVLVLNEKMQEIRPGETGEIYVRGAFLASGYYGDPQKTAAAFIQNPAQAEYPEIVYKTGDLARLEEDGLYFCSRTDLQIKHMGHRIEPGEIESLCRELPGASEACVFLDEGSNQIVLVLEGEGIGKKEALGYLRKRLPRYMLPHKVLIEERLPRTEHGKLDRRGIREGYQGKRKDSSL